MRTKVRDGSGGIEWPAPPGVPLALSTTPRVPPNYGTGNPTMNRHFRNIQTLTSPTLKLHFISLCEYFCFF